MTARPPSGPTELLPGVLRLIAPNPSPMTHWGTNTWIVGQGDCAVIDPGPDIAEHRAAIRAAVGPARRISHILVTHAHRDHSAGAARLATETGAPLLAFGRAGDGRSAAMQRLAAEGLAGGGEGLDADFAPDRRLSDGVAVEGPGWRLEAIHTPGHLGGHLCFALGDVLFSGDHVMGWASTLISPPDGDLTDFMASCRRLAVLPWRMLLPGHGPEVGDPAARLQALLDHRLGRERAILAALASGPQTVAGIAAEVYTETPPALLPAARRNVFAHLVDLASRGHVRPQPRLSETALFALI